MACRNDRKKEEEFKKLEDKRVAAERVIAAQKERERKIREQREREVQAKLREEQRKQEAVAQKIAEQKADAERREIARKEAAKVRSEGVKLKATGESATGIVDYTLEPFFDNTQKLYGFKRNNQVVFQQAFVEKHCIFTRLDSSNYFCLSLEREDDKKSAPRKEYIVDRNGKILKVAGIEQFDQIRVKDNQIVLFKDERAEEFIKNEPNWWLTHTPTTWDRGMGAIWKDNIFFADKQSAEQNIYSGKGTGGYLSGCNDWFVIWGKFIAVKRSNLGALQSTNVYRLFCVRSKCVD